MTPVVCFFLTDNLFESIKFAIRWWENLNFIYFFFQTPYFFLFHPRGLKRRRSVFFSTFLIMDLTSVPSTSSSTPAKRGRGRPRKSELQPQRQEPRRKRGRPRKPPPPESVAVSVIRRGPPPEERRTVSVIRTVGVVPPKKRRPFPKLPIEVITVEDDIDFPPFPEFDCTLFDWIQ